MVKTEVFENDYVTVLDTTTCACPEQRWDRFQPLLHSWGRAKPIEKRNVWTRISLKTEGKLSILIQNGYVSKGA